MVRNFEVILILSRFQIRQGGIDIYDNKYGFPEITPSKTIKSNSRGGCDVFNNRYGIPEITPHKTIKPKDW